VFRVSASDTLQAAVIVEEAVGRRGLTRLAILHDATNYGVLGSQDLIAAMGTRGRTAVVVERFQLRETDMRPQLERARAAGAQAVLTYGIGPELAHIANSMARLGWQVPIIGSWTLAMSSFIELAGRNAEGARMPQTFIAEARSPAQAAFLAAWERATGSVRIPVPPAAAQGYDSMQLLAAAIRQAGSLRRSAHPRGARKPGCGGRWRDHALSPPLLPRQPRNPAQRAPDPPRRDPRRRRGVRPRGGAGEAGTMSASDQGADFVFTR
jgi:branched-chain amino acid transport system substrate-binding protein